MSSPSEEQEADRYPRALEQVVRAHLAQQSAVAADLLAGIGAEPAPRPAYQRPSTSTIARIYARDRYHCRYCAKKVILTPVMRLLALLHPDLLPYHPNWKVGQTHPAFAACSATVDHVVPLAAGGDTADPELVTACWTCNRLKGDLPLHALGWTLHDPPESTWSGLSELYRPLWEAVGRPELGSHEMGWLRALDKIAGPPAATRPLSHPTHHRIPRRPRRTRPASLDQ